METMLGETRKSVAVNLNELKVCPHSHVMERRCHLHKGWCGVCQDCGANVYAPEDHFFAHGVLKFRNSNYHTQVGF